MNYHNKEWIMEKLQGYYDMMCNREGEDNILGVFYYGSANYNIDTEFSDVDAYCLVFPSIKNLALNKTALSYQEAIPGGSLLSVKDYRLFFDLLLKQSINCLETLFTDYYIINPTYQEEWNKILNRREEISYFDVHRLLLGACGMMYAEINRLERSIQYCLQEIRNDCDGKALSHLYRLQKFINKYYNEKSSFEEALAGDEEFNKKLIKYKTEPLSMWIAGDALTQMKDYVDSMRTQIDADKGFGIHFEVRTFLRDVQESLLCKYLMRGGY